MKPVSSIIGAGTFTFSTSRDSATPAASAMGPIQMVFRPDEFGAFIAAQTEKWGKVVRRPSRYGAVFLRNTLRLGLWGTHTCSYVR